MAWVDIHASSKLEAARIASKLPVVEYIRLFVGDTLYTVKGGQWHELGKAARESGGMKLCSTSRQENMI